MYGEIYLLSGLTLVSIGVLNYKFGGIALTQVIAALFAIIGNFWWAYYPAHRCVDLVCAL